eukprot:NODE_4236_length_695_cov_120.812500.p1 GENE.NODE_4236_length_695_cov_120.812500~~NODE_4236_length_695_cov_120.812500.p1  ORF type:complete len:149 (-),score=24.22 NODE_4236_length_695_cov_120.812500:231-677(-)
MGAAGFSDNHPRCRACGGCARPAILMFGDGGWQDVTSQDRRWQAWCGAVAAEIARRRAEGSETRIAMLEIGAGGNVTTVRFTSEAALSKFRKAGADVCLVRVNPTMPLGDREEFQPDGAYACNVISILDTGLACLQRLDAMMPAALRD